jgi:hypothetical protein
VNANDATLTELATAQSGSMVGDDAPNAPASAGFDLIIGAVADSALGSSGAPYTLTISAIDLTAISQPWPPQILRQAFDAASGWKLSGIGPTMNAPRPSQTPSRASYPGASRGSPNTGLVLCRGWLKSSSTTAPRVSCRMSAKYAATAGSAMS